MHAGVDWPEIRRRVVADVSGGQSWRNETIEVKAQRFISNEALGLARELLSLVPETVTPETDLGGGMVWPAAVEPRPRFRPPDDYDRVVSICLAPLVEANGERAFEMLCDLLEEALRISLAPYQAEGSSDIPYHDGIHESMP